MCAKSKEPKLTIELIPKTCHYSNVRTTVTKQECDDTNHVQKLVGLISLCPICHQVKHIGRAIAMGRHQLVYNQLMKVNKWTPKQVESYILKCFETQKERSKYQWKLDISILSQEPYNIKLKETKERIFEIKKFKRKKKTSKPKTSSSTKSKLRKKPKRK